MLINGIRTLTIKCNFCSKLMEYDFNVFKTMVKGKTNYKCKCGEKIAEFKSHGNQNGNLTINCFKCKSKNNYKLNIKDILEDNNIYCPCGTEILFLGNGRGRNKLLMKNQINIKRNTIENMPEIYKEILKQLSNLNDENKLDCDCGKSKLDIDFFYDSVEIKCLNCYSVSIIFAETEEDLSVLLKKDKITLKEHNISCIDSVNEMQRNIKK